MAPIQMTLSDLESHFSYLRHLRSPYCWLNSIFPMVVLHRFSDAAECDVGTSFSQGQRCGARSGADGRPSVRATHEAIRPARWARRQGAAATPAAASTCRVAKRMASLVRHGVLSASRYTHTHTHTQPFNGLLSGTTRVGRYQKKHSPTHTHSLT